ncbi:MAG TPA: hypothetical protein VMS21_05465 [Methylomirabilota bacterium]|nr:hypothetical protein [Methylomirabilota bacterium]
MQTNDTASREQLTIFQLVLLILSIAVLAALQLDTVAPVTDEVSRISGLMASLLLGGRDEESSEMRVVLNKLERLEQQLGLRGAEMKEGG